MSRKLILISLAMIITISCGVLNRTPEDTVLDEPVSETPKAVSKTLVPKTIEPSVVAPPTNTVEAPIDFSSQDTSLSPNDLNATPPNNILEEISYFGSMGGCGRFCQCFFSDSKQPELIVSENSVEIYQSVGFEVCRPDLNEAFNVSVELPSGKKEKFEYVGEAGFEYVPDLPGVYKITVSGSGFNLDKNIQVMESNDPRLYLSLDSELIFHKFEPNERVRVLAYEDHLLDRKDAKLIGWKDYVVDNNGELTIRTELTANYVVIGEKSGQVFHRGEGEWRSWARTFGSTSDVYCDGAPEPVGLKLNGKAEVLKDNISMFEYDSNTERVTKVGEQNLGQGTIVGVVSNALCYDGMFLWEVNCADNDCRGWIPEADSGNVYLQPIDNTSSDEKPDSSFSCPDTPEIKIEVGKPARVTFTDGRPVRVRNIPSTYGLISEKIPEGTKFQVISGPQCSEYIWWKIKLDSGVEGWVAEGNMDAYFIEPVE